MKKRLRFFNHAVFLSLSFTICCVFGTTSVAHASITKVVVANLAYWDQVRGFQDIQNNVGTITEVSPNWYTVTTQGIVAPVLRYDGTSYVDASIISYLKANNIRILPMIQNVVNGNWNSSVVSTIINSPTLVANHISSIVNLVVSNGYDGIDIDYESLLATDRTAFSNFVRDLSTALHAQNKILSINVHSKTHEPGYWDGPMSQDWSVIGSYADEVRIMLYGYSWQTSPAGPISPIGYVNEVLTFANTIIPSQKIIQGIPTYGLDWPTGQAGVEDVWDQFVARASAYGSIVNWDTVSMSPWFQYTIGGNQHTVWFENASSTEAKINSNNLHNAAGIFIWRLGGEDLGIWNVIRSKFGIVPTPVPSVDIKANGSDASVTISNNASATISWSSTNVDSCTVSPTGWNGVSNGGISTGNLLVTTIYTINCIGPNGTATDTVTVIVNPPITLDTIAPTVIITEPVADSTVSRKRMQISATATDNVQVTKVSFYVDNNLLSSDTSAPYTVAWNAQKASTGTHTIKVVAYDAAGNTASAQITVRLK